MLPDLYAGFVRQVDENKTRREIRVEVPPYTDGASILPKAEICYPIGDDSRRTAIRIKEGTPVWLAFRGGDPRYPIIMGYRNANEGNEADWRRWEYDNIDLTADKVVTINASEKIALVVGGVSFVLTPESIAAMADAHTVKGPVTQTGGDFTSDGISVQNHPHKDSLNGMTSKPLPA